MPLNGPNLVSTTRVYGDSPDVVVLAHGFGLDQTSWRHIVPALSERYRVVVFDLAGFTTESRNHYDHMRYSTLSAYAEDLIDILRALKVRRCRYVGHSVSGMVGVLASLVKPALFEKLILLGASPHYLNEPGYLGGLEKVELNGILGTMVSSYSDWAQAYAPLATARPDSDPAVAEFCHGLMAMRPDVALSIAVTIFRSDLRKELPKVTVPCSILQTREDAAVPMGVAEYLRDHLPGSVLEVIDTKGHVPQLTAPDAVLDALRRHLA